jgi:hypothetical protein
VYNTQDEREKRIWKLLQEKIPYREICKREHCSSNEVSRVNKKFAGKSDGIDIQTKNKSLCSQVFDCFLKKLPLPQIVRDLDTDPEKVNNFHNEFLLLENKDMLVSIWDKNKVYRDDLLMIDDYLSTNNIDIKQLVGKIDSEKRIKDLEKQNTLSEVTNFNLNESQKYWQLEYKDLNKKYKKLLRAYRSLQSSYQSF